MKTICIKLKLFLYKKIDTKLQTIIKEINYTNDSDLDTIKEIIKIKYKINGKLILLYNNIIINDSKELISNYVYTINIKNTENYLTLSNSIIFNIKLIDDNISIHNEIINNMNRSICSICNGRFSNPQALKFHLLVYFHYYSHIILQHIIINQLKIVINVHLLIVFII